MIRLTVTTLAALCLFATAASAQTAEYATAQSLEARAPAEEGDPCAEGECTAALTAWSGCPDDPCGGVCLAGKCYEVRPVIAGELQVPEGEPAGATIEGDRDESAALIAWEGCPEVPCGGLCLAGLCYEVRPLTPMETVCER